jgi:hypothetical protein
LKDEANGNEDEGASRADQRTGRHKRVYARLKHLSYGCLTIEASTTSNPHPEEPRSGVSKDAGPASWFETHSLSLVLLTMRVKDYRP